MRFLDRIPGLSPRLALASLLAATLSACGVAPAPTAAIAAAGPTAPPKTEVEPVPREHLDAVVLGMGCFWGAERRMAALPGVIDVESGYANGEVPGTYAAVLNTERARRLGLSDKRNHAEVVKVVFDTRRTTLAGVLAGFWENHDPTQGDRQGNDIGSNYRSAIYTHGEAQMETALATREAYQRALDAAGRGAITTEIAPLTRYIAAEDYHQDYLVKNPDGYCGLGGTGVKYPSEAPVASARQLVVFETAACPQCERFNAAIGRSWQAPVPLTTVRGGTAPQGLTLASAVTAAPTVVLFEGEREVSRFTGFDGDAPRFWAWLGSHLLDAEQRRIAFRAGTERAFTGPHLEEKRPGTYVDPITGAPLFRSDAKYDSGTGWPSFYEAVEGGVTYHGELSLYGVRTEIRSASSGIHLGHVFEDGPRPTGKRYCMNGRVLRFVPDPPAEASAASMGTPATGV